MSTLTKIGVVALVCCVSANAQKHLKPGERDMYNDVVKDLSASGFTKALADLDAWRQKFPDSDFRDERTALYIQSYAGANQPRKLLDVAADLMTKDLNAAFTGQGAQATIIRVLYNTASAIAKVTNPSPSELATGEKAARELLAWNTPIPDLSADKWTELRNDMREKARSTLLYIAMLPGIQAMAKQPPDCAVAESAYSRALVDYRDSAALSYELGRALNCESKTMPEKQSAAVYEFLRAAVIDPTLGDPRNDKKKIESFADNAYARLHGSEDGLDALKQQVTQSALPPADFRIASAAQIADAKEAEFEKDHPQLALWMKIKAALLDTNGEQYFESQLKDAAVPQLIGTLVEARPACRPRELLVAVPELGAQEPDVGARLTAEILLKLDQALDGKPELNASFEWEGVPSAFTKEPFLLTMDAEKSKLQGLNFTPCAPARRGNPKNR